MLYFYFQNRPAGNPRGPCGRPGARGHHVGDPCSNQCICCIAASCID